MSVGIINIVLDYSFIINLCTIIIHIFCLFVFYHLMFGVFFLQSSPTEKALANQFLAPGRTPTIANERMAATKTVHMQAKARCTREMRDELLSKVACICTLAF